MTKPKKGATFDRALLRTMAFLELPSVRVPRSFFDKWQGARLDIAPCCNAIAMQVQAHLGPMHRGTEWEVHLLPNKKEPSAYQVARPTFNGRRSVEIRSLRRAYANIALKSEVSQE